MKKKLLAVLLVMAMCMSMLTGCAQIMYGMMKKADSTEVTEVTEDYVYDDPDTEEYVDDTEEDVEEDTEEVEEDTTEESTEAPEEDTKSNDSGEVDFEVVEATLENPAKIGEWVATKEYSAEDEKYHTIYYRITSITRGDEAKKIVDEYNADDDNYMKFDELEYDDLEFCYITYETHYPADFPDGEYGLYSAEVDLNVCNLENSGAIEGYIGLSSVWDISERPEEFYAGDTFTKGEAVFAMVKDFSDYLIYARYYDDDNNEYVSYVKGE